MNWNLSAIGPFSPVAARFCAAIRIPGRWWDFPSSFCRVRSASLYGLFSAAPQ